MRCTCSSLCISAAACSDPAMKESPHGELVSQSMSQCHSPDASPVLRRLLHNIAAQSAPGRSLAQYRSLRLYSGRLAISAGANFLIAVPRYRRIARQRGLGSSAISKGKSEKKEKSSAAGESNKSSPGTPPEGDCPATKPRTAISTYGVCFVAHLLSPLCARGSSPG